MTVAMVVDAHTALAVRHDRTGVAVLSYSMIDYRAYNSSYIGIPRYSSDPYSSRPVLNVQGAYSTDTDQAMDMMY